MSEPHEPSPDDRLEAYLDGLVTERVHLNGHQSLPDQSWKRELELQGRIDAGLRRLFQVTVPPTAELEAELSAVAPTAASTVSFERSRQRRKWPAVAALFAAAAIGYLLLGNPWFSNERREVVFTARPLVDVYRETVAEGFEPYYECREAERFADTFEHRQGQAMKLLPLGAGARMLGLSYPGGLSRDTTAMLCRVDDKPVMVFVDLATADQANAVVGTDDSLRIFRSERNGLVFYEVTPFDAPRVADAIVPLH